MRRIDFCLVVAVYLCWSDISSFVQCVEEDENNINLDLRSRSTSSSEKVKIKLDLMSGPMPTTAEENGLDEETTSSSTTEDNSDHYDMVDSTTTTEDTAEQITTSTATEQPSTTEVAWTTTTEGTSTIKDAWTTEEILTRKHFWTTEQSSSNYSSTTQTSSQYSSTTEFPWTTEDSGTTEGIIVPEKCPSGGDVELHKLYNSECPESASNVWLNGKYNDYTFPNKDKLEIHYQNKVLLTRVLYDGCFGSKVGFHPPVFGFKLLEISAEIYAKFCPTVPTDFVRSIFRLFHYLHWITGQGRTEIIKEAHYLWVLKLLKNCSVDAKPLFTPQMDNCKEELYGADSCTNCICTVPKYEFNLNRTDPVVDAMWKVYELVHATCFPTFEEGYRMFHRYAIAIMDLWTKSIKLRWINQLEKDEYWKNVLGPNYEMHLVNMERCTHASIKRSNMPYRLPRHSIAYRPRLHGDPGVIPECKGDNKNAVIQFVLVQDATASYTSFVEKLASIMPNFLKILSKEFPHTQYALTSFVDYINLKIPGLEEDTGYCYKLEVPFSMDHGPIISAITKIVIQGGGMDGPESSLTGIMYTAADEQIGWSRQQFLQGKKVYKVIAFTTDEEWKSSTEPGYAPYLPKVGLVKPKGDGLDTCEMAFPSAVFVRQLLEKRDFYLLGLIAPHRLSTWEKYFDKYEFKAEKSKLVELDASQADELAKNLVKEFSEMIRQDQCGI